MAFPATPLEVRVDLAVDRAWTDVTGDVLVRDGITVTRGRADEAAQTDPSTTSLTLENRDGRYSPRNPVGALYGKIGRNSPLRVGVGSPPVSAAAASSVDSTSLVAPSVTAPAAGMLFCVWGALPVGNITGPGGFSMGVEVDGLVSTWVGATKSVSAGATGTSTATHSVTATDQVALSVVVPGAITAGGFSGFDNDRTSATVTVTDIAAGDYLLAVQGWSSDPLGAMCVTPAIQGYEGLDWLALADTGASDGPRLRAWICRAPAGLTGSALFRFYGFDGPGMGVIPGAGDNYGRVWRVRGATDYFPRHVGEVSEWPQRWDLSGVDVYTSITASGVLRRLGQGDSPLRSSLNRHIVSSPDVLAYWPLEEPEGTTEFASPIAGVRPAGFRGTPVLAADDTFLGSEPLPTWQSAGFVGLVPGYAATGELFAGALIAIPAGGMAADGANLLSVGLTGGTISRALIEYRTSGSLAIKLYDRTSATTPVLDQAVAFGYNGAKFFTWLTLKQNGANLNWQLCGIQIVDGDYSPTALELSGTLLTQTLGQAKSVNAGIEGFNAANGALSLTAPVTIGHITIAEKEQAVFRSDAVHRYPAVVGHVSEGAVERIVRLCREEGIEVLGHYDEPGIDGPYAVNSTALGPQRSGTLLELVRQAADADGGILYEPRGFIGLAYRTRQSRQNQAADATLTYTTPGHIAEPFEPVDDDQATRNDITVTRIGGASARAERTTGPLSTQPPPAGVGRYDESVELSLWRDSQAADAAGWRLHIGTWDEARYPQVTTYLEAHPADIPAVAALDCGERIRLTALPAWLPPGPTDIGVEGYSETLEPFAWRLTFNASPAGPYRVADLDDTEYSRLDSEDSVLASDATSGALVLYVETDTSEGAPLWITTATHPTEFPFEAIVGGEVVTVTGVTHGIGDFFTRAVVDGWGSASTSGQAWALGGGNGPDFDVNGSAGTFTNTQAVNVEGIQEIAGTWEDVDQTVTVTFQSLPVAANIFAALWARRGTSAKVKARLFHTTTDTLNVDILGNNAATVLGTANTVLTGVNGVPFNVRLQVSGTTARLKVWRGAEPTKWTLEVTDTAAPAAGGIALSGLRQTGNTNVNPVMEFDNYAMTNPQRFVVTRATNGIAKSHATGAQIRLHKPVYIAQGGDA